jgi:hypothetical protein
MWIYRVDVKVVERGLEVGRRLVIRLLEADVLQRVPLEEHLARLDVYLLGYPV